MGWLDGWFGAGGRGGDNSENDPLRKLDPKLREFLKKESPIKYTPASAGEQQTQLQQQQQQQQKQKAPLTPASAQNPQQPEAASDVPAVPRESQFQDGRYADLWKTYQSQSSVEASTKSDHEKLMDVLEGFKERKLAIGGAALENCSDEQLAWSDCMKNGDWAQKMTMCHTEVQRFERCYMVQSRLLKALGYLSTYDRPREVDEDIQMHADALYQRMLEQETAIEKAKAEGLPVPKFPPLLDRSPAAQTARAAGAAAASGTASAVREAAGAGGGAAADAGEEPNAATLAAWRAKLEKLPDHDRAAEEAALRAEHRAKAEMASQVQALWQEQAKEREARKDSGGESIGDKLRNWIGPK
ncbi:hypothetical protein B0T26DRAFT_686665 [Lasiosphaeria miniovina]|uniref:Autophagy-related protein 6 n=1 Tax=Lasiosphaeria miniovina TaxID=1954250 RepID=A0AA40BGU7_9PEZI|nr:uncharacterized protein B0T26DRAFT_686665 [Lasiosphaeria miniovina]KAK0733990.1 hypothetical protein B0T26DRAFT_686665 [Lasiosphaeria miniovina]